jgi:hypothetical protein
MHNEQRNMPFVLHHRDFPKLVGNVEFTATAAGLPKHSRPGGTALG